MTIPDIRNVNGPVEAAIGQLNSAFSPAKFWIDPDGQGGAFVRFEPIHLCPIYVPVESWVGGHLPAQIPYADVYPLFVRGDLKRIDGRPFVPPITAQHTFMGVPAIQISRRSNRRDSSIESVVMKFEKVLFWMNQQ